MLRHTLPLHGKVAHRPLKKQAVHPTKKAVVREIIKRNASDSPLLKLAPEIREMIWKAAIGDRAIHIKHFSAEQLESLQRHQTYPGATEPNGAFRHIECTAKTSEQKAYIASKIQHTRVPAGEDPACYVQSYEERHYNCYTLENGVRGSQAWVSLFEQGDYLIDEKDRITMCTMLGTCRKVYEEAYQIFWLSNDFSFDDPSSLREFLGSLTLSQKRHLTSLQICERLDQDPDSSCFGWANVFRWGWNSVLDLLSGLRTFHLCLEQRSSTPENVYNLHASGYLVQPWLALRPAPLSNVTVVISDKQPSMEVRGLTHIRWTVQRKSEVAEAIRNSIIDEHEVAEARQYNLDKKASLRKRREKLKQMKVGQELEEQARYIPKNENYPIAEITPATSNEVSRPQETYGSMYDDIPREIRAPQLLEMPAEQRSNSLTWAHTPYIGSLGFLQAAKYSEAHELPQGSPEENVFPSFIRSRGDAVVPQVAAAQAAHHQHHILYHKQGGESRNVRRGQTLEGNVKPQYSGPLPRPPLITYQQPRQLQSPTAINSRESRQVHDDYLLQQDNASDSFYPRPQYRTLTAPLMGGAPVQDIYPTQQTVHDSGSSRFHPYDRTARSMHAHLAAHVPGTIISGPQEYAGVLHFTDLVEYAHSAVSAPPVAYAGTNGNGFDPEDQDFAVG